MTVKQINDLTDCKKAIIQIEIDRWLLSQEDSKMTTCIFNRLWLDLDTLLKRQINKVIMLFDDEQDSYRITDWLVDYDLVKSIIYPDNELIDAGAVTCHIRQDVTKWLENV